MFQPEKIIIELICNIIKVFRSIKIGYTTLIGHCSHLIFLSLKQFMQFCSEWPH